MNRFMVMAVAVVLLAAGGAASAAEKEAPIDWPARAATVKVGMTRAEVWKILPPPGGHAVGFSTGASEYPPGLCSPLQV